MDGVEVLVGQTETGAVDGVEVVHDCIVQFDREVEEGEGWLGIGMMPLHGLVGDE